MLAVLMNLGFAASGPTTPMGDSGFYIEDSDAISCGAAIQDAITLGRDDAEAISTGKAMGDTP